MSENKRQQQADPEISRRDAIFACCKQLQQQWFIADDTDLDGNQEHTLNVSNPSEEKKTSDDGNEECPKDEGPIVSTLMLTDTLVPALRELLRRREEEREERENRDTDDDNDTDDDDFEYDENDSANLDQEEGLRGGRVKSIYNEEYMDAILECLAGFVLDEWDHKTLFVTCGAFEMTMHVLRQFLEEHKGTNLTGRNQIKDRNEWKAAVSNDVEQILNGMEDSSMVDLKASLTPSSSKIPALVLTTLAHLTEDASEELKKDRVLPLLQLVHESMTTFLSDAVVQGFGCWILHNLSNPLLQELVAAGSMSVIVSSLKCHPSDCLVQEHGNAGLFNLLPLILNCNSNQRMEIAPMIYREISSLIPSLPAVVLRGMEQNAAHLSVQQYGLLVLNRICQKNHDHYEVFISEGGLTVLLNSLKLTTTKTFEGSSEDGDILERRDCLAQLACQFVRDLSRPTNSSMDIVRIIAIKGGVSALVHLLEHYNADVAFQNTSPGSKCVINIVDPAMACLRNLFCHTENIRQVMADNYDNHRVIPTVLQTMDCFPHDAAVQAYGCDCLGRLSQVDGARREITNTVPGASYSHSSDAMVTIIRAMANHRNHAGVQERAIVLLWVLTVHDNKHSSSLISRLREAHNEQQQKKQKDLVVSDFLAFLKDTKVTPKGIERLEELVDAIEQYEQGNAPVVSSRRAAATVQKDENENPGANIRSFLANKWAKLRQVEATSLSP
ncbi:hypothetical protein IV203_015504 [Nitzschia inconspicua]|uniref:Uncharacterized protein n=1 Tax=Nitzschia inconspicua TaxID=303405 RepID=A0A9K3PT69_9STRA|nr:hypothetical protein IV203_015504 [Nitzschia inconspicua]